MSEKEIEPSDLEPEPSVAFAGFRLWVFGRQFPDSKDYWDGNWIVVKAECDSILSKTQASWGNSFA